MSIQNTANNIIKAIGINNVKSISHCATRIRIVPKNPKQITELEETDLIKGSLFTDTQFQVFVQLSDIEEVYQEIENKLEKIRSD